MKAGPRDGRPGTLYLPFFAVLAVMAGIILGALILGAWLYLGGV